MKDTLRLGLTRQETVRIDPARVIDFLGEDGQVYATPFMVSDVEYACWRLLNEHLDANETSVGVHVTIEHLGATPLGCDVRIDVEISGIDRRRVDFETIVRDAEDTVGRMRHSRFVIDAQAQVARIKAKSARLHSR
jgi:fluoroacetyl-CoA thioesterase